MLFLAVVSLVMPAVFDLSLYGNLTARPPAIDRLSFWSALILIVAYCGSLIYAFTAPDAGENLRLLLMAIRWNQSHYRCADHFLGSVSEDALRPEIPTRYNKIQILSNDRIVG